MQGSTVRFSIQDDRWSTHMYLSPLKIDPHLYGNSFYNKCGTSNQWKNMEYPMSGNCLACLPILYWGFCLYIHVKSVYHFPS